jgi:hypothetical protein
MPETPPRHSAGLFFLILALLLLPSILTLRTILDPGTRVIESADPTPLGYTWSLSLFLIPLVALCLWFRGRRDLTLARRAFFRTLLLLVPLGILLDFFFGNVFFVFPNHAATLGIALPSWDGEIPIEEYVFYLSGFAVCLLAYIWADEVWERAYNVPDYRPEAARIVRMARFHPLSAAIGAGLLAAAVLYKRFVAAEEGFPWYFAYLVAVSFVPSIGLYKSARAFINWRAFALVFFLMLLVSLLWEATLGVPYGWWGYRPEAMLGVYIGAWSRLPLEAACVWLAVTFTTVIFYEVFKIAIASGRSWRSLLPGEVKAR